MVPGKSFDGATASPFDQDAQHVSWILDGASRAPRDPDAELVRITARLGDAEVAEIRAAFKALVRHANPR